MGERAKVAALPDALRAELDQRLVASGFAGYVALSEWLTAQGYEIGKSSIHRYGSALERRLAAIRASTEAARQIAAAAPDDADDRSAAVISLVQTGLFEALLQVQEAGSAEDDPAEQLKLLSGAARSIAELSRASVNVKKYAAEVAARVSAAAEQAEKRLLAGGAGADLIAAVLAEIKGIAA